MVILQEPPLRAARLSASRFTRFQMSADTLLSRRFSAPHDVASHAIGAERSRRVAESESPVPLICQRRRLTRLSLAEPGRRRGPSRKLSRTFSTRSGTSRAIPCEVSWQGRQCTSARTRDGVIAGCEASSNCLLDANGSSGRAPAHVRRVRSRKKRPMKSPCSSVRSGHECVAGTAVQPAKGHRHPANDRRTISSRNGVAHDQSRRISPKCPSGPALVLVPMR